MESRSWGAQHTEQRELSHLPAEGAVGKVHSGHTHSHVSEVSGSTPGQALGVVVGRLCLLGASGARSCGAHT
jgi:hypothetical protein